MKRIYKKLIIGLLMLILITSLDTTLKEGSLSSDAKKLQRWLEKGKGVMSMYVDMPI
jgi:hypothetical protein